MIRTHLARPLLTLAIGLYAAHAAPTVSASEPAASFADLFVSKIGDYALVRIPGLVATPDGTVLAYCEARRRSGDDWGPIDLKVRRSEDCGVTWGPIETLVEPPPGAEANPVAIERGLSKPGEIALNNPTAVVDAEEGLIHMLFCVSYARCYTIRSNDGGRSWSEPEDITAAFDAFRPEYPWRVLATGPGHGIQLLGGRLVVPVWLSTGTGGHAHRPSAVSTIVSDDHGRTWRRGDLVVAPPELVNPSETAAVALSDGRVMLNIRHESAPHLRAVVDGPDGAGGWSKPRLDPALPEPICFGALAREPGLQTNGGPPPIYFANPHNPDGRERKNLTIKRSDDDGATWSASRALEPGPSGYSDLAVLADGTILCLFERGVTEGGAAPATLTLARIDPGWLEGETGE